MTFAFFFLFLFLSVCYLIDCKETGKTRERDILVHLFSAAAAVEVHSSVVSASIVVAQLLLLQLIYCPPVFSTSVFCLSAVASCSY